MFLFKSPDPVRVKLSDKYVFLLDTEDAFDTLML